MSYSPLTAEELRPVLSQIHRRCIVEKPGGVRGTISATHVWRIFSPKMPDYRPTYGLARAIAAALTELLGRPVTAANLFEYLERIGKPHEPEAGSEEACELLAWRPSLSRPCGPTGNPAAP